MACTWNILVRKPIQSFNIALLSSLIDEEGRVRLDVSDEVSLLRTKLTQKQVAA
jgi:hypothetical protein